MPNSCSENDCLLVSFPSTTEENWRSMSSSCVADAPWGRFCSFSWFWHSASVVFSSLQFLLFLFKYRVNNSKIIIKPTMVDTPAITSTIGGESAMEKMKIYHKRWISTYTKNNVIRVVNTHEKKLRNLTRNTVPPFFFSRDSHQFFHHTNSCLSNSGYLNSVWHISSVPSLTAGLTRSLDLNWLLNRTKVRNRIFGKQNGGCWSPWCRPLVCSSH